ncbi:hypothetical protein BKA56DRAFT_664516 [Ilyonectria sp. MPI-CAGE-AT-0026]|nr:hypothetical protein BKA56DRAFT_664516 [Ilyonectria sp. MPI-CAGE-AT-0026]
MDQSMSYEGHQGMEGMDLDDGINAGANLPLDAHHFQMDLDPMVALQTLNWNQTQMLPPADFIMPWNPHTQWLQHPWAVSLDQQGAPNVGMLGQAFTGGTTYDDGASMACSSHCGVNCTDQCEETPDASCCFDASCVDASCGGLEMNHSVCCFDAACGMPDPCLDDECTEAGDTCTDANCMVPPTVYTTPASASIPTPPTIESDPMINPVTTPADANMDCMMQWHPKRFKGPTPGLNNSTPGLNNPTPDLNNPTPGLNNPTPGSNIPTPALDVPIPALKDQPQSISADDQFSCRWVVANGDLCGFKFENHKDLQSHCKEAHLKDLEKATGGFNCSWYACTRRTPFSQKSKLERHMQTHTGFKPVACNICGILLSAKQSLEQHMRTHSGEKPWKCKHPGCTQSFKQQSALTMHTRTHTGEKPLMCEICGKRFGESSNLSKHRRTHNVKGGHVCDVCGKDFHRLDQLRRHMKTKHEQLEE